MRYDIARIRRERTLKGWNQTVLAEKAKLHPSTISQIERGELIGSPATIKAIADALKVEMKDLLIEEEVAS